MQKSKLKKLREEYPKFVYEKYSYKISGKNLEIFFDFTVPPDIKFRPKIIVDLSRSDLRPIWRRSDLNGFENFIFHLGLIEIPSYWKTTCSPIIEIKAGHLSADQIKWWKNLIISGMGQFYYENKIDWRGKNFLKILSSPLKSDFNSLLKSDFNKSISRNRYLVPFAGGRDSIVTIENLKKKGADIALFTVNPIEKIQQTMKATGIKKQIIVRRLIDKKLLELNKKGYLNGHTPFTGLLSFLAVFCAVLFNYKNIAFSNEKSADEGNVKYLGKTINHQWAKSSEFEKMFKSYVRKYLAKDLNYFSFIRKYGELEISKMFAKHQKYFPVFSSCNNRGVRWCGNCPKCLFVYASLYPFLKEKQLLEIFGQDIFANKKLLPVMKGLSGQGTSKPFECVGTFKESQMALKLSLAKARRSGKLPYLLMEYAASRIEK